jgi:hypothetical protein
MRIEAARKAAAVRWQKTADAPLASGSNAESMPGASAAHAERNAERNAPTQPNHRAAAS